MREEALKVLQDVVRNGGHVLSVKHQQGYYSPGVNSIATYLRDMGYVKFTRTVGTSFSRTRRNVPRHRTNYYKVTPLGYAALDSMEPT